jgi:hypothetical protein
VQEHRLNLFQSLLGWGKVLDFEVKMPLKLAKVK